MLEHSEIFDTHVGSEKMEVFIDSNIPQGWIVAAACKNDCVKGMSQKVRQWF